MFENVVGVQMPKRPKTRALERFLTTDPSLLTRLLEAIGPSAIKIYAHFKQEVASAVISNCASTRWDHRDIEALLQGYQPAFVECGLFVEFHRQDLGCDDGSDFFFFLEVSDIRRGFGRVEMQLPAVRRSELLTRPTPPKLAALLQARDAAERGPAAEARSLPVDLAQPRLFFAAPWQRRRPAGREPAAEAELRP